MGRRAFRARERELEGVLDPFDGGKTDNCGWAREPEDERFR